MHRILLAIPLLLWAGPALAEDRPFCANRPGLGTPPCTLAPGQAMVELGLANWDHLADLAQVEDDLSYGDTLLRLGLGERTELELGFGGYTTVHSRERASGALSRSQGAGDLTIALRRSLSGPGGAIALHGYVTLPTGANGIGAGDWSAGLLLPAAFDLPGGFELDLTPELDAAANASGKGRHLAWGGVAGLSHPLGARFGLAAELGVWRDVDPAGAATDVRAAISLTWQPGKDWQFDLEGDAGLSAAAPRHSLALGLAHRF